MSGWQGYGVLLPYLETLGYEAEGVKVRFSTVILVTDMEVVLWLSFGWLRGKVVSQGSVRWQTLLLRVFEN